MGTQGWEGFSYPDVSINNGRTLGQKINTKEEITSWMRWIHVGPTWQLLGSFEQPWFHDHDKKPTKLSKKIKKYVMHCYAFSGQNTPIAEPGGMASLLAVGDAVGVLENEELLRQLVAEAQGSELVGHLSNTHGISGCLGSTGKSNRQEDNARIRRLPIWNKSELLALILVDSLLQMCCSKLFFHFLNHHVHPKGLLQQWMTQTTQWSWSP